MKGRRSWFSSRRERKLWSLALATVVAIWSTLGVAGTLVETLRDRNLLDAAYVVGFLVVLACIAFDAVRNRRSGREMWALVAIAMVYAMIVVRMGIPVEERTHLFEYGLVSILVHRALKERWQGSRGTWVPAGLAVAITAALGWLDEGIQAILPNRVYDLRDVGFNALAGLMTVTASLLLSWVRRRASGQVTPSR